MFVPASSTKIPYLLLCIAAIGSQAFLLILNLSPDDIHMVPSFPPIQYNILSKAATPQDDLLELIEGTELQVHVLGSHRSTLA